MIFAATPIQMAFGMWGLAITEVILLSCAVIPALICRWNFKEVFPVKKPGIRAVLGTLILWFGSYIAVLVISIILAFLFPKGMADTSQGIADVLNSTPLFLTLGIAAVMPAVCEEALHRGLILFTFQNVKRKWVTMIVMGLIFGLFHLDPYRFLTTAVLGLILTYIMIRTDNLLLPMLFHLINNASSVLISSAAAVLPQNDAAPTPGVSLAVIGAYLFISALVPLLFLWGSGMLQDKAFVKSLPGRKKARFTAVVLCIMLAGFGVGLSAAAGALI
ncbi:hypothetical protein SDC9_145558 [bioreactor metagenome]|uniref:CAAX prenyl protease 2/Lysostaphin resistance protein A-like domain-containing protein n=1 Tax=bioreactor metagenome TaxID=1076179 RepID=A0A645ECI7_9ZZZZ